jgi:cell fate regulator YaaT (PSP1 superfamily)
MTYVVAVKLHHDISPQSYLAHDAIPSRGDHVVVETDRGEEIGLVTEEPFELEDEERSSEFREVVRTATDEDLERADELERKGKEAMPVFRELVEKRGLDMKPVAVEFLFGREKAVFYFSAEERVDFRELVRDLASRFHMRIDMRQIGVRDEARMVGGISHCGEELCCRRFGNGFKPVSIRMAKEQDLPLNPSNISGICGRLMCCLRYEYDAYKDFKSRAPKKGALIETPLGTAKVVDFNTPLEQVTMRLEDGKQITIPLAEMSCAPDAVPDENGNMPRPCRVSREALEAHSNPTIALALSALDHEGDGELEDKTVEHSPQQHRRSRRRSRGKGQGSETRSSEGSDAKDKGAQRDSSNGKNGQGGKSQAKGKHGGQQARHGSDGQDGSSGKQGGGHRRRRSRGKGGKGAAGTQSSKQGGSRHDDGAQGSSRGGQRRQGGRRSGPSQGQDHATQHSGGQGAGKVRPGQHSSGVRASASSEPAKQQGGAEGSRRKPRRRHQGGSHDGSGAHVDHDA